MTPSASEISVKQLPGYLSNSTLLPALIARSSSQCIKQTGCLKALLSFSKKGPLTWIQSISSNCTCNPAILTSPTYRNSGFARLVLSQHALGS